MSSRCLVRTTLITLALLLTPLTQAQTVDGTLLGSNTDSLGAIVPAAKITLAEIDTQISSVRSTNASGNYEFPFLKPGRYRVTIELAGFKKGDRKSVV